jgi:hypothetical protein
MAVSDEAAAVSGMSHTHNTEVKHFWIGEAGRDINPHRSAPLHSNPAPISYASKMAVNVASRDPPITLARRLELQETRISLRVMPHMMVFKPSLADVWSEQVNCPWYQMICARNAHLKSRNLLHSWTVFY